MGQDTSDAAGSADSACANCGHVAAGSHCPSCGQKRVEPGDLSLRHAWHHLTHELLHLDGRIWNTFRLLLTSPGTLSCDFLEGRRARHIHPIRLFIVIGIVFFIFAKVYPPFDVGALQGGQLSPDALRSLDYRAKKAGITREQLLARASEATTASFKGISVAATVCAGFVLWVLFRRQRRYLAENMVVALHLASFNMMVWLALGWLNRFAAVKSTVSALVALVVVAYFLLAARRVYGGAWWVLFLKWIAVEVCKSIVLFVALTAIWVRVLIAE